MQRGRQAVLVELRSDIDELQTDAWVVSPNRPAMTRTERGIIEQLRSHGLGSAVPAAHANFAVLDATGKGNPNGAEQARTYHSVAVRLRRAAVAAGRAAEDADTQAIVGSSAALGLLLIGFWLLNVRLGAAHQRELRQRAALEETLLRLEGAQADRMRLLASTVQGAEEERRRIAADLHDGPIQRLTATALSLDLLANRVRLGRLDSVEDGLREVRDALAEQMGSLRRLMAELRPPVLDEGGVAAAIANHASRVLAKPAACALHDRTGAARFTPELETAVYRIAGEALANVAKHSRATRVDVLLERRGDELKLTVVDDGVGFTVEGRGGQPDHLGLTGMRERVESVGGRLAIRSAPGTGTRVEAVLPWRARPEEERRAAA